MPGIFDRTYELIDEFVCRPENARLKAGTGRYSTLFRGTLFGQTLSAEVDKALEREPVKVLWLGSNPNVPDSLRLITEGGEESHYPDFVRQRHSGHFSEVVADSQTGKLAPGWDPVNNPTHGWRFYTEIFDELYGPGHIVMANYVPWGSQDFPQLIRQISALDPALLKRMLDFSTRLNRWVIESIQPELIVAPKSIFCRQLQGSHLCFGSPETTLTRQIDYAKVPFHFTLREIRVGALKTRVLVSPHPSYTPRVGKEYRQRVQGELADALRSMTSPDSGRGSLA